jgi:hypothetical protein
MSTRRAPPWTREEISILRDRYPQEGLNGVADLLPERSWQAIHQMAWKLSLRTAATSHAPRPKLAGAELEEAVRLREQEGWSFARIGATFGVCEASATNAVLIALCTRRGFRPAERDDKGRLTEAAKERLRLMLRKGLKGVDIQIRLGVSAACVAEQRRRYAADLKARGKAPLPPPGAGERYSGAKVPASVKREIERLYLEGFGTAKITRRTGVSNTHCLRVRDRLIKRLARKGETLPGCDANGVRRVFKDHARHIPEDAIAELRRRLIGGDTVRGSARLLGIGLCSAYRIRDRLAAELEAKGEALPKAEWRGRARKHLPELAAIEGTKNIFRFRQLCRSMPADQARAQLFAELEAEKRAAAEAERQRRDAEREARTNRSFEEKLAAVARGEANIAAHVVPTNRRAPDRTLGGIASGML